MMMHLFTRLLSDVPMIMQEHFIAWCAGAHLPESRFQIDDTDAELEATHATTYTTDRIAIIPVKGVLAFAPSRVEKRYFGMRDSRAVLAAVQAEAMNDNVAGIVLDIHSPGGMHIGGPEISDMVKLASRRKPVTASITGLGASLAYMIASQATDITASRSSSVGSIGTIISFMDYSRMMENAGVKVEVITNKEATMKGAGTMGSALTEAQRESLQARVDSAFSEFRSLVTSARPWIKDDSMKGQSFWGAEALERGLVDRIGDMAFAVGACRSRITKTLESSKNRG